MSTVRTTLTDVHLQKRKNIAKTKESLRKAKENLAAFAAAVAAAALCLVRGCVATVAALWLLHG